MSNLTNLLLGNLAELGFFELLLPWILFFAFIYVVFKKTNLFLEETQNIVVSLAISFFIINFTTFGFSFSNFLTQSFGYMAMGVVIIIIACVFCGMMGVDIISLVNEHKIIFLAIGVFLAIMLSFEVLGNYLGDRKDLLITMFFIICIFGGLFYVTKS
ncbi:MAG: hypothetical protein B6U87_02485 [Candidatus Aenigmarchaeota archaeon ex4484_52]|nr:MAG: hypothetical protein B6U87_02485 [Candidatus Aenigmarchaeota archaeon ex4484_52]